MDDGRQLIRPEVRSDFVPADAYISPDYAALEEKNLWPKVWLMVCREEQLKKPGDFVTYEIGKDSILVVKVDEKTIKAFFNVCQHRGRRLKEMACGNTGRSLRCKFHGWSYNLDGSIQKIYCRQDWDGVTTFKDEDLRLPEVRMDKFAGWIWISMDPNIEPLLDYLSPVADKLKPYALEETRFAWAQTIVVNCNWKVVVDAFNEAYHAPATHPSTFLFGSPGSHTEAFGKHAAFWQHSLLEKDLGEGIVPLREGEFDMREKVAYHSKLMYEMAKSMVSTYACKAGQRMLELPEGTSDVEVMAMWMKYHREGLEADGAKWPENLTPEFLATAATDLHIFPNTTLVPVPDGALWHRMRPNGDNPASCLWDIWSLQRYPPGKEPDVKTEFFPTAADFEGRNPFLEQDFANMELVQKGMWSRGFRGGRTNPVQEITVSNFHKVLYDYLFPGT